MINARSVSLDTVDVLKRHFLPFASSKTIQQLLEHKSGLLTFLFNFSLIEVLMHMDPSAPFWRNG